MINDIKIEICVGDVYNALKASKYPIDRIELNSSLELGGLTPSLGSLIILKQTIKTPLHCMVRPRTGDFDYSDIEFESMLRDTKLLLDNGADGIVFGFVKNGKIQIDRTKQMVDLIHSYHKDAVFHRAIEDTDDLEESLKTLIDLNIERVLTSGLKDINEGKFLLHNLQIKYGDKIQILPGGGVNTNNVLEILNTVNSKQIHMSSKKNNPNGYLELDEKFLQTIINKIEAK